jgi:hypothetical protein
MPLDIRLGVVSAVKSAPLPTLWPMPSGLMPCGRRDLGSGYETRGALTHAIVCHAVEGYEA